VFVVDEFREGISFDHYRGNRLCSEGDVRDWTDMGFRRHWSGGVGQRFRGILMVLSAVKDRRRGWRNAREG
jgi:hypothetical protein